MIRIILESVSSPSRNDCAAPQRKIDLWLRIGTKTIIPLAVKVMAVEEQGVSASSKAGRRGLRGFRRSLRCSISIVLSGFVAFSLAVACGGSSVVGPKDQTTSDGGSDNGSAGMTGSTAGKSTSACSDGQTRACVGPAACAGGQVCRSGAWSSCDCGEAGGGGSTDVGGAGGGAQTPGGEAAGGAAAGAPAGGAPAETPDACPTANKDDQQPPWDCSGECFKRDMDKLVCGTPKACSNGFNQIIDLPADIPDGTALIRVPAAAAFGGPCECNKGTAIQAKLSFFALPDNSWPYGTGAYHIKATVRLPWHVGLVDDASTCAPKQSAQCLDLAEIAQGNESNLQVWTEDPGAPAVNLEIAAGDCQ